MKTATLIRKLEGFRGDARLYGLSEPMSRNRWNDNDEYVPVPVPLVIVSAVTVLGEPETYIFAATPNGHVEDWCELDGSFRGGLDHAEALRRAGYAVVEGDDNA